MQRTLEGPARYFAEHPLAYALSLAGASAAVSIFATRAAAIFIGIVVVREEAHRALQLEGPRSG